MSQSTKRVSIADRLAKLERSRRGTSSVTANVAAWERRSIMSRKFGWK